MLSICAYSMYLLQPDIHLCILASDSFIRHLWPEDVRIHCPKSHVILIFALYRSAVVAFTRAKRFNSLQFIGNSFSCAKRLNKKKTRKFILIMVGATSFLFFLLKTMHRQRTLRYFLPASVIVWQRRLLWSPQSRHRYRIFATRSAAAAASVWIDFRLRCQLIHSFAALRRAPSTGFVRIMLQLLLLLRILFISSSGVRHSA